MLHVHVRAKMAVLQLLHHCATPISAEAIAERIFYSVPQTKRTLAACRADGLIKSTRRRTSHALAYSVDEEKAKELGLL